MQNNKFIKGLTIVSGATLLVACGGGGSDSNGGSGGTTLSLDSENYAAKRIAISADSNVDNIVGLYDGIADGLALIGEVEELLLPEGAEESRTVNCDSGGTLTVSYNETSDVIDQLLSFRECIVTTDMYGSVLLNGTYEATITISGESEADVNEAYNITGEVQESNEPLQIKGTTDTNLATGLNNNPESFRLINTIDVFEIKIGTDYAAITNAVTRINTTDTGMEFSLSGKVLGSAIGGYIDLSTPTPVEISDSQVCPTSGVIRIASEGSAEVRYGSSAGGTASAVAVWIDGQVVESYSDCSAVGFTSGY